MHWIGDWARDHMEGLFEFQKSEEELGEEANKEEGGETKSNVHSSTQSSCGPL